MKTKNEYLKEQGVDLEKDLDLGTYTKIRFAMEEYAKDYHESEVKKFRLGAVMVQSEQLPCSHCGRPLKEHSKDSKLCPDRMKNFEQGN